MIEKSFLIDPLTAKNAIHCDLLILMGDVHTEHGRVITQIRGRAIQILRRTFSFIINPQKLCQVFKKLRERFRGSAACFETNTCPH